ncbi:hypothetical protein [Ralstonia insidiosa]|uniref:Uncharacterized protein n=1 Tax=Ralstonia insidiosa TaxID=190721 RepID=A0A848P377_9RALS|nr:hypothetical protein [Ralstonia insidiosa]NMV39653.1 hypothetical protein [Ralstonia insidiosa]
MDTMLLATRVPFKTGSPGAYVASDVRLGNDPISALSKQAVKNFGAPISGSSGCNDLGPSPGGFSMQSLACKRNTDGSAAITGLYAADLQPGEQITVAAWSTEYLSTMPHGTCDSPTYAFPDKRQFGIPGEYIGSNCTPPDGLELQPSYFATCHNPLSGIPRNIWVTLNGGVSSTLAHGGSVIVSFCRATTLNLNPSIPANARPQVSIDTTVACN